mgnify:CR=1 FL=1
MRALVVDDSLLMQQRIGQMLRAIQGLEVVGVAANVLTAIALFDEQHPELVVLDVELDNGDKGIAVLEHVMRRRPETVVVVLSNFTWDAMRSAYIAAGAQAYFDKALGFTLARDWVLNWRDGRA